MALFSRRKRTEPEPPEAEQPESERPVAEPERTPAPDAGGTTSAAEPQAATPPEAPPPTVGISVTSFGGLGAPASNAPASAPQSSSAPPAAPARGPAEAPPQTETVPGLRDNGLLREALTTLGDDPTPAEMLRVGRQVLQNHLFLRVKGDARALLAAGEQLPLAVMRNDDAQWVLAYSSGAALQRSVQEDGDTETSAMGQPTMAVLSHVLAGDYAGMILDPASAPARLALPRELIERMVAQADPKLALKTILAEPRTPGTAAEVARAMVDAPLFVAVNRARPDPSGAEQFGVAEVREPDGTRLLELYSHPLEVIAMGREDRPLPFTAKQLAGALAGHDQLAGVVLDAAGPWIRLSRDDLAPVLALADA